jgi:catechol 2,3-dioxygenase-like lactoylglutathione lyase family enzyme
MNEIYKAIYLSPMVPSYNIEATKHFFTDLFGFSIVMDGDYTIVKKDSFLIHILRAGENIGEMEFYLEVDDIDNLWLSIQNRITDYKKKSPFNREYGMREFHIIVPYTKTLMFVGMVIK